MHLVEWLVHYVLLLSLICCTTPAWVTAVNALPKGVYSLKLGNHRLFWGYDWHEKWIKFQLELKLAPEQWFAFGFSDRGDLNNADFCIFHSNSKEIRSVVDAWTDDKCLLEVDFQQDCKEFHHDIKGNTTRVVFTREFDTCDLKDYVIEEGTTHLVYASGFGKLQLGQSVCDQIEDGMVRTTLLRVEIEPNLPPESWAFSATVSKLRVPDADTTYWCHLTQLPERVTRKKHHLIRFEPIIDKGHEVLVHHMELFHCEKPPKELELTDYSGPCNKKPKAMEVCKKVLAAWAMGASPFNYPPQTGLPVGGKEFSTYVMLETHYDNPLRKNDWIDSSGFRIYLTPKLRKYDAGVIELGLEYVDKMAIPPQQKAFQLTGYCIAECISVGVPFGGIFIFASQLHTHLTGVKVETVIVRKQSEISRLDLDSHYSPHYQEIRLLRKETYISPGNALYTRCTYNTMDRKNMTLGGFGTTEEMCVNYIYYYPKVNLEVCKSSISDRFLMEYFDKLNTLENQNTGSHMPISQSYNNIEWTPLRVKVLDELYHQSRIYMQCNKSNGDRFPGQWQEMSLTKINHQLPKTTRCLNPVK